jgi:hypothetical protein
MTITIIDGGKKVFSETPAHGTRWVKNAGEEDFFGFLPVGSKIVQNDRKKKQTGNRSKF